MQVYYCLYLLLANVKLQFFAGRKMSTENLMKMCRTCLTVGDNMRSVFAVEELMEQPTYVRDILMSCAAIEVRNILA